MAWLDRDDSGADAPFRRSRRLKDEAEAQLAKDGYALLSDVFSIEEVSEAAALMHTAISRIRDLPASDLPGKTARVLDCKNDARESQRDHIELFYPDVHYPRLLETAMFRGCSAIANAIIPSSSMYFNSVISKEPHGLSFTMLHRDSDFSGLGRHSPRRLHFWIPLQDTQPLNGGLEFVAGSHKNARPLHIDSNDRVQMTIPAGSLSLHLPHTLHGSGPNLTDKPRMAWLLTFGRFGKLKLGVLRARRQLPKAFA